MFEVLKQFGIDTAGFDQWALHAEGTSSIPVWIAACIFILLFFVFAWPAVRAAPGKGQRSVLFGLRVLVAMLILGCLFQPALRLLKTAQMKTNLAVLIDTSESMGVPGRKGGESRIGEVEGFLKKHQGYFQRLGEKFSVHYFGFDQGLHALAGPVEGLEDTAGGKSTEILEALVELERWWKAGPLAGVILFSDGQDTGRLRRLSQPRDEKEEARVPEIPELEALVAPVHTIIAGDAGGLSDIVVRSLVHDEYAFVHNPFEVVVRIGIVGEITSQITVTLKGQGQVLASRSIKIAPGQTEAEFKLDFIPRQVGEFFYTVEVPVYAGEASAANNSRSFVLNVLRDKVRVLYIVGNPSWDERFLRRALKKNPSVDLVSFYILREYFDDTHAPESELALIPFPTNELFTRELDTFDLVIFQNFFGVEYMRPEYMRNLSRFVRERGGGLLVIGGIRALIHHSFNSPLEEILPVRFSREVPNYREGEFTMRLTQAGQRHPVTCLSPRPEENVQTWESLPALSGFNLTLGPDPQGLVLGEHPFERGAGGNLPVIAVRDVGQGRSMVVATDSTWRWNFLAVGGKRSNKPYQIFWDRALRWLLKDPEMKTLSLTRDKGRYDPGGEVTLAIEVLDASYKPADEAKVRFRVIEEPQGSSLELPEPEPAGKGKYLLRIQPRQKGAYRISASAEHEGRPVGTDEVIFEVSEENPEFDDLSLRPDLMSLLAERTGGSSLNIEDSPKGLEFKKPQVEKIIGTRDFPIWDNAVALILIVSILVLEWFLRRRWGLS
jgi:hypothetical protein